MEVEGSDFTTDQENSSSEEEAEVSFNVQNEHLKADPESERDPVSMDEDEDDRQERRTKCKKATEKRQEHREERIINKTVARLQEIMGAG